MNRKEKRAKALPAFRRACVKYRLARAKAIMELGLAECVKDADAFLQKVKGIKRPVFADFCKAEI